MNRTQAIMAVPFAEDDDRISLRYFGLVSIRIDLSQQEAIDLRDTLTDLLP